MNAEILTSFSKKKTNRFDITLVDKYTIQLNANPSYTRSILNLHLSLTWSHGYRFQNTTQVSHSPLEKKNEQKNLFPGFFKLANTLFIPLKIVQWRAKRVGRKTIRDPAFLPNEFGTPLSKELN